MADIGNYCLTRVKGPVFKKQTSIEYENDLQSNEHYLNIRENKKIFFFQALLSYSFLNPQFTYMIFRYSKSFEHQLLPKA